MTDFTSVFRGFTMPPAELYDEIHRRGWQVTDLKFSDGAYLATAKNPHGDKAQKTGRDEASALATLLLYIVRLESIRGSRRLAVWSATFNDRLEEIAKAYAKAPIYDPKAAPAWKELADDSMARYAILADQLEIEVVDDPDPYEDIQAMCDDVKNNQHFLVSRAQTNHPVWTAEQQIAYRAVHDVLGHCVSGGDYSWEGENRACAAHFPLLTRNAQQALFSEALGQSAYTYFYRALGPQKVALLPDFMEDAQSQENAAGHAGVHPNLTLSPIQLPTIESRVIPLYHTQGIMPVVVVGEDIYLGGNNDEHLDLMERAGLEMADWYGLVFPDENKVRWYGSDPPERVRIEQELSQHLKTPVNSESEGKVPEGWAPF